MEEKDQNTNSPQAPVPPTIESPPKPKFFTKKKIIIFLVIAFVIILPVGFFLFTMRTSPTLNPTPNLEDIISNSGDFKRTVPDVEITQYNFQTENPQPPQEIPIYTLQTNFSKNKTDSIASVFNLSNGTHDQGFITYSKITPEDSAILNFNTVDGSFTYQAFTAGKVVSSNPQVAAKAILSRIGLSDNLIDCDITYKRKEVPDVTFVECHRSWEKMGLPLVSLPGFYNTPEEVSISQMRPGIIDSIEAKDPAIIQVSTGQNGLTRPNDFNSATVAVTKTGSIISVVSNLRFIESESTISSSSLLDPSIAKSKFSDPLYSIVLPSGNGATDLGKVFPENKGKAKNATVMGYDLVYLEKLRGEKQIVYEPFYVIRGEAMLENGFQTKIFQAVPALANRQSVSEDALQIDTFSPSITPTLAADVPKNSENPQEIAETACGIENTGLKGDYTLSVPGYGTMQFGLQGAGNTHTLYLISWNKEGSAFTDARRAVDKLFENTFVSYYTSLNKGQPKVLPYVNVIGYYKAHPEYKEQVGAMHDAIPPEWGISGKSRGQMLSDFEAKALAFDRGENVSADGPGFSLTSSTYEREAREDFLLFFIFQDRWAGENPCYITGGSPSIFIRGNGDYKIVPSHVTYSEPQLKNDSWNVSVINNTLAVNKKIRNFLYYEFNSEAVKLTPSMRGYSFRKDELSTFISKVSFEMGLTDTEEKQFFNEVNNEISGNSKYITLKLVSSGQLSEKLPLNVSPTPLQVVRLHFIIEEGNEKVNLEKPELPKITGENIILELGASKLTY